MDGDWNDASVADCWEAVMGSDRHMESRYIAESNFWPARALLVRAAAHLERLGDQDSNPLYKDIMAFLARTENA